jgi:hypothetical protein
MALDIDSLANSMVAAASSSLGTSWNSVRDYATEQFRHTAMTLQLIEKDTLNGSITQEQATNLLDIQKQATEAVMLAVATMTVVAVQQAINSALNAVKSTVNSAVGFGLL